MTRRKFILAVATLMTLAILDFACARTGDERTTAPVSTELRAGEPSPLPSWRDGAARQRIVEFVGRVTTAGSADFVPVAQRIAVFDNDGTLWNEQPMYVQLAFALDRVKALAPRHPEWENSPLFKAALDRDLKAMSAMHLSAVFELSMAAQAGLTTEEFKDVVNDWLATARHPRFHRPYTDLVYEPMLELLAYLRDNGFKTFIVSGGNLEFLRPWTERVYGIPPEQVVGSSFKTKYELRDGRPVIVSLPELDFIDNKDGKALGIERFIGRRPIIAFGNSDGDIQMLEWTTAGAGPRLAGFVHHDDGQRESAYDRTAAFGRLDHGLDEAAKRGWLVISMKNDWKRIFPFEK